MNNFFSQTEKIIFGVALAAWIVTPSVLFAQVVSVGDTLIVNTQPVSDVSTNGATLNGYASHESAKVTLWFEWGTTTSLGKSTQSKARWEEATVKTSIDGLTSGARYYYRAVAISGGETLNGEILSFVAGINGSSAGSGGSGSNTSNTVATTTGNTNTNNTSNTTTNTKSTTNKTTTSTTNKKTDAVNCATTTAAMGSLTAAQGSGSSGLTAQASSSGAGSIIIWLGIIVVIVGIAAGAMHMMTIQEEMRRKKEMQKMIIA